MYIKVEKSEPHLLWLRRMTHRMNGNMFTSWQQCWILCSVVDCHLCSVLLSLWSTQACSLKLAIHSNLTGRQIAIGRWGPLWPSTSCRHRHGHTSFALFHCIYVQYMFITSQPIIILFVNQLIGFCCACKSMIEKRSIDWSLPTKKIYLCPYAASNQKQPACTAAALTTELGMLTRQAINEVWPRAKIIVRDLISHSPKDFDMMYIHPYAIFLVTDITTWRLTGY